jgi:hypothetical protein
MWIGRGRSIRDHPPAALLLLLERHGWRLDSEAHDDHIAVDQESRASVGDRMPRNAAILSHRVRRSAGRGRRAPPVTRLQLSMAPYR